jgi:hypothetical protein
MAKQKNMQVRQSNPRNPVEAMAKKKKSIDLAL